MNRPQRSIEIFTMSALDLFVTAMGSFAILMMILFPYYNADKLKARSDQAAKEKKTKDAAQGVKGETVLMCVWPTRVQDFAKFMEASGYDGVDRKKPEADDGVLLKESYTNPGYEQQPTHPVVGVSWLDAMAFCDWLTKKEREAKEIGPEDYYRLPTDEEWSAAAGPARYPWGDQWPPPENSGNLAGEEFGEGAGVPTITGYRDEFEFTAPVGSFTANHFGLYDMAGNVSQWCLDWYRNDMNPPEVKQIVYGATYAEQTRRAVRGSSWRLRGELYCRTAVREPVQQRSRREDLGFRCVLVVNQPPAK